MFLQSIVLSCTLAHARDVAAEYAGAVVADRVDTLLSDAGSKEEMSTAEMIGLALLACGVLGGYFVADRAVSMKAKSGRFILPIVEDTLEKNEAAPEIVHLAVQWGIVGRPFEKTQKLVHSLSPREQKALLSGAAQKVVETQMVLGARCYQLLLKNVKPRDFPTASALVNLMHQNCPGSVTMAEIQILLRLNAGARNLEQVSCVVELASSVSPDVRSQLLRTCRDKDRVLLFELGALKRLSQEEATLLLQSYERLDTDGAGMDLVKAHLTEQGEELDFSGCLVWLGSLRRRGETTKLHACLDGVDETSLDVGHMILFVRFCEEVGAWERIAKMVDRVTQSTKLDGNAFCCISAALGRRSMFEQLETLLKICASRLQREQWTPAFNAAITAYSRAGRGKDAIRVFSMLKSLEGKPDVITYSAAINAAGKERDANLALELLEEMNNEGVKANLITFNSAISACEKAMRVKDAFRVLEMIEQRADLSPDGITFNSLLAACAHTGAVEQAKSIWSRMSNSEVPKTALSVFSMVKTLSTKGLLREAVQLFVEVMESQEVEIDKPCFRYALQQCCAADLPNVALQILAAMRKQADPKLQPEAPLYAILLRCYAERKQHHSVLQAFECMIQEWRCAPDVLCFEYAALAAKELKDVKAAEMLVENAQRQRIHLTRPGHLAITALLGKNHF